MKIKLNFTQVNALAKPKLEMFTNSFSYHDSDYFHKNIGSLFGVIQVSDHSKNSEYLPNLLTSILKKTFYSNTHKTTEENFELALRKVNLALADLAEHDIIEWNKNLHAIVGVLHKNTLFFTQVGDALILIGRDDKIMHLSEQTATTHPIKTFRDVVVGKIELSDKIIISTPTIADIFKFDDISRLFKTFSTKEFDDIFLKTLKKEGENVSTVIINVAAEKELDYSESKSLSNENLPLEELTQNKNFLGGDLQSKKDVKKIKEPTSETSTPQTGRIKKSTSITEPLLKEKLPSIPKKNTPKKESANISKKQALDAVQEEAKINTKKKSSKKQRLAKNTSKPNATPSVKKEKKSSKNLTEQRPRKLNDLKEPTKKETPTDISPFEKMQEIYIKDDEPESKAKKPSAKKLNQFFQISNSKKSPLKSSKTEDSTPTQNKPSEKINAQPQIDNSPILIKQESSSKNITEKNTSFDFSKKLKNSISYTRKITLKFLASSMSFLKKLKPTKLKNAQTSFQANTPKQIPHSSAQQNTFSKENFSRLIQNFISKMIPLLQIFSKKIFQFHQIILRKSTPFIKKYRLQILIILFIILIPVVIGSITKSKRAEETTEKLKLPEAPVTKVIAPSIPDKNKTRKILSLPSQIKLLAGNDTVLVAYTADSQLYEIDKKTNKFKKINLPTSISLPNIKAIDYIDSLNLFFLSSDTTTISYSPKVKKFIANKITLPSGFKLAGQNTYLSYLYLLDSSSKQIYRYPRATGGFDTSKKWLKTPLSHNDAISAMAIDENVRIAYLDGTVEKYSKGRLNGTKKFALKSLDFIETTEDLKSYYLSSKTDGKILRVNKNTDKIEKEYQNSSIQNATTFVVDEKTKLLYIFKNKELLSIDL